MRILRVADVAPGANARAYIHSRTRAIVGFALGLALATFLAIAGYRGGAPRLGIAAAAFVLLITYAMRALLFATFRPGNWLVIADDLGLYIKFRSYLNTMLSNDDPTVAYLPYREIRSARLVFAKSESPDAHGATQTMTRHLIELELSVDTAPLRDALAAELVRKAPPVKRWYGASSTLYGDYPVQVVPDAGLDIEWHVVPGARAFLQSLAGRVTVEADVHVDEDLTRLQQLDPAEQERRIRALAQRGQLIAAVHLVRRLNRCSVAEAKAYVEALQAGTP